MKVLRVVLKGGGNIDIPLTNETFDLGAWAATVIAMRAIINPQIFIPLESVHFVGVTDTELDKPVQGVVN
jgi:hypothetical protein